MKKQASLNFHSDIYLSLKNHMPVIISWSKLCKPIQSSVGRSRTEFVDKSLSRVLSFRVYLYDIRRRGSKKLQKKKKNSQTLHGLAAIWTQTKWRRNIRKVQNFFLGNICSLKKKLHKINSVSHPLFFFF